MMNRTSQLKYHPEISAGHENSHPSLKTCPMKKSIILLLLVLSLTLYAQEGMPDVYAVSTQFERIEVVRMSSGTDLLDGLNRFLKAESVKNAVILTGIGSVTDYHYHVVSDKNLPPAQEYPKGSVAKDLVSVQGYIFNGRVHAHIALSDENSVIGGHLEPGTIALTFFILTVGVLPDDLELENFDRYRL
jgi:predicted DNA-binding protein with PD1-like motif